MKAIFHNLLVSLDLYISSIKKYIKRKEKNVPRMLFSFNRYVLVNLKKQGRKLYGVSYIQYKCMHIYYNSYYLHDNINFKKLLNI